MLTVGPCLSVPLGGHQIGGDPGEDAGAYTEARGCSDADSSYQMWIRHAGPAGEVHQEEYETPFPTTLFKKMF